MSLEDSHYEPLALPLITENEQFPNIIAKLSKFIQQCVQAPSTFEQFRLASRPKDLSRLIRHLGYEVKHRLIVPALLASRSYFVNCQTDDEPGVNLARAYACEFIAWRYVLELSEWESIDCLLEELNLAHEEAQEPNDIERDEESNLLTRQSPDPLRSSEATLRYKKLTHSTERLRQRPVSLRFDSVPDLLSSSFDDPDDLASSKSEEFVAYFDKLNALEIAAVSGAKKFLSQRVIQKLIEKIWRGDIVFWETLTAGSNKEAKIYNKQ